MGTQRILITGATGQVGSHLLWTLWRSGHEVTALVRRANVARWGDHLAAVERTFGSIPVGCPVPRVLEGDLWKSLAGVSEAWIQPNRAHIDLVIHAAADTRFHPKRRDDQWRTNVTGALRVANLATALEAPHLIHLSTVFVGGAHAETFRESDLLRGQRFRCSYEKSKCEAEIRLRRWAAETGRRLTVLRPGIVIGDSREGATLRHPHLYGFMRALWRFEAERLPGESLRLPCDPDTRLPLVCVDQISEFVRALISEPHRAEPLRTWHLMAKADVSLRDLCLRMAGDGRAESIEFDPSLSWQGVHVPRAARALWSWVLAHRPYLMSPGEFAAARTWREFRLVGLGLPEVSPTTLLRVRDHWRERVGEFDSEAAA